MDEAFLRHALDGLASTPSVSGSEAEIGRVFADLAREAGLEPTFLTVPGRAPDVIASVERGVGPTLLFNGHLDTLPVAASGWMSDPYVPRFDGGWYVAAEVNNMKAALAGMLTALRGMQGHDWHGRIVLMAVVGECDTLGLGTRTALDAGLGGDMAINGEPTDLMLLMAHAGVTQFELVFRGRSAHISQRHQGHNAITDLARAVAGLDERILRFVPDERFPGLPTLNVGRIEGGSLPSMLAAEARMAIDVRLIPGMTPDAIREDIRAYLGATGIEDVEIIGRTPPSFMNPPAFAADPASSVVRAVAEAHEATLGRPCIRWSEPPQVFFGSDASHLSAAGIPTCIYGPGDAVDINVPNERIAWGNVVAAARVYEGAALRLLQSRAT